MPHLSELIWYLPSQMTSFSFFYSIVYSFLLLKVLFLASIHSLLYCLGVYFSHFSTACLLNVGIPPSSVLDPVVQSASFHWTVASTFTACYLCADNFYTLISLAHSSLKHQTASWTSVLRCPTGISLGVFHTELISPLCLPSILGLLVAMSGTDLLVIKVRNVSFNCLLFPLTSVSEHLSFSYGIRSHHFMGNRWGNSVRLYFSGPQNHCRW